MEETKTALMTLLMELACDKVNQGNMIEGIILITISMLQLSSFIWIWRSIRSRHLRVVTFEDEIKMLTLLIITCALAYGARGIAALVLSQVGAFSTTSDESQIVEAVFEKALFFNFVLSFLDLSYIVFVYVMHYRNFSDHHYHRKEESLLDESKDASMSF